MPLEKLVEAIDRFEVKLGALNLRMVDCKAGKEVALGATQIDPRGGLTADSPFSLVLVVSCPGFLVS